MIAYHVRDSCFPHYTCPKCLAVYYGLMAMLDACPNPRAHRIAPPERHA